MYAPFVLVLTLKIFFSCFQVLGRARVVPGNGSEVLRGVFQLYPEDDISGSATLYVETPHPGMTLSFDTPKVYLASDLSDKTVVSSLPTNVTDVYSPCTVIDDHGYSGVWEVELPSGNGNSDTLDVEMCSPGGYDQVRPLCTTFALQHKARLGVCCRLRNLLMPYVIAYQYMLRQLDGRCFRSCKHKPACISYFFTYGVLIDFRLTHI